MSRHREGRFASVRHRYRHPITQTDMMDRDFLRGFVKLYTLWRTSREPVYGLQILD